MHVRSHKIAFGKKREREKVKNEDHSADNIDAKEKRKLENNNEGHLREVTRQLRGRTMFQHRSDLRRMFRAYKSLNEVQASLSRAKGTITHCVPYCLLLNYPTIRDVRNIIPISIFVLST